MLKLTARVSIITLLYCLTVQPLYFHWYRSVAHLLRSLWAPLLLQKVPLLTIGCLPSRRYVHWYEVSTEKVWKIMVLMWSIFSLALTVQKLSYRYG